MCFRILVVGEDTAGDETTACWCETIMRGLAPHLADAEDLGIFYEREFLEYKGVEQRVRSPGFGRGVPTFHGAGTGFDYVQVRKSIYLARRENRSCLVVCRDIDDQSERRASAEKARREASERLDVVLAIAAPEVEAWHVAAWKPGDEPSEQRFEAERRRLGFSPTQEPHRLSSSPKSPREAKAVKRSLEVRDAWRALAPHQLRALADRHEACGLKQFVDEFTASARKHLMGDTRPALQNP
jgi:hypothetical protein